VVSGWCARAGRGPFQDLADLPATAARFPLTSVEGLDCKGELPVGAFGAGAAPAGDDKLRFDRGAAPVVPQR